jgi:hypothetical protein
MSFLDGDPIVSCKMCGEEGLQWKKDPDLGFRLYDEENELHSCGNGVGRDELQADASAEPTDEEWSEGESTH